MGKGGSPPPAPDYRAAAQETAASNQAQNTAQTHANRPNMNTPWGQSRWTSSSAVDPATGQPVTSWQNDVTLSPEDQAARSAQMRIGSARSNMAEGMLGRVGSSIANPMSTEGLPSMYSFNNGQMQGNANLDEFRSTPGQRNQQNVTGAGQNMRMGVDSRSGELSRDTAGGGAYSDSAQAAIEGRQARGLRNSRSQLETQLTQQGLAPGSEAWKNAMGDQSMRENDAQMGAITAGLNQGNIQVGQEQARSQFQNSATGQAQGMDTSSANFQNQAQGQAFDQGSRQTVQNNDTRMRDANFAMQQGAANNAVRQQNLSNTNSATQSQAGMNTNFGNYQAAMRAQAMQERTALRGQPLNEMNAFLGGQQIQQPTFGGPNSTANRGAGTDFTGAARDQYSGQMDGFSANQAQRQSNMNGLFSLGNAAMMFSDERLKDDITPVGELKDGTPLFSWTWKGSGESDVGVIAQDIEQRHPELVKKDSSGIRMVNYGKLIEKQRARM